MNKIIFYLLTLVCTQAFSQNNVPVSSLPVADTLGGADFYPVVQGGHYKKAGVGVFSTQLGTAIGNTWHTNGNTGTSLGNNFLGTADSHSFVIKSNNQPALLADSLATGNSFIWTGGNVLGFGVAGTFGLGLNGNQIALNGTSENLTGLPNYIGGNAAGTYSLLFDPTTGNLANQFTSYSGTDTFNSQFEVNNFGYTTFAYYQYGLDLQTASPNNSNTGALLVSQEAFRGSYGGDGGSEYTCVAKGADTVAQYRANGHVNILPINLPTAFNQMLTNDTLYGATLWKWVNAPQSGNYLPTITDSLATGGITLDSAQYIQTGQVVTVSGSFYNANTFTLGDVVNITLPVPSTFTKPNLCAGVVVTQTGSQPTLIYGNPNGNYASFIVVNSIITGYNAFQFTYSIR